MISKFKSIANSKLSWVIVALIAIPFVFWGMGDVFTRGNTNSVAKINNNTIEFTAPFKKWVHYAIVINQNICSIYKNAVLEKTIVLENSIEETSNINIGGNQKSQDDVLDGFPGFLQYLYYFNDALSYESIYKLYKQQYLSITGVRNEPYNKRTIKDDCGC